MGDRWTLTLACAHCGHINKDVWYAPTCGAFNFTCEKCKKVNGISEAFCALKEPNNAFNRQRTKGI